MSDQDFMAAGGYQAPEVVNAPQIDPNIDAAVRTAYSEAGKDGWAAVAGVLRNRAVASGKTFGEIAAEPNAFEGYQNDRYKSLKAGSPQYQAVLQAIQPVLSGSVENPVGAADGYYSPTGQKAKGREPPSWSVGKQPVANIGGNTFYTGVYTPAQAKDFMAAGGYSAPEPNVPAATPGPNPTVTQETLQSGVIARPRKLSDSAAFMGYHENGEPAFNFRDHAGSWDVPSTDPNLPPPPKGYYWPLGTEMGTDGKPRAGMGPFDPNRPETFNLADKLREIDAYALQRSPSGQAALAAVGNQIASRGDQLPTSNNGPGGVSGSFENGVYLGNNALLDKAAFGLSTGAGNLWNRLTGQPIRYTADEAARAADVIDNRRLLEEQTLHPVGSQMATLAGSLIPTAVASETGIPLVRAVPGVGSFLAGEAGSGSGALDLLARTASRGAAGGVRGATAGAASTNLTDQPWYKNALTGAELGGAFGAGGSLAYDTTRGVAGLGKAIGQPFSEAGRNEIVGDVLRKFADGGPTSADLTEYVPGSTPTLAQATGNPGLAAVERAVKAQNPNAFSEATARAQEARQMAVEALRGDSDSLDALRATRASLTDPIREQAFANAQPVDIAPVQQKISEILASPSGQRDAVVRALGNIRSKIAAEAQTTTEAAGPTSVTGKSVKISRADPAQLYGIRQAITDMLSPLAQNDASAPQLASKELMQVKSALDDAIEQGAPGYKQYLKTYSDASRPIDEQMFLQRKNFTDASGRVTMARVKAVQDALDRAELTPGISEAKSVSPETRNALNNLYADLSREASAAPDRTLGSNTFQNLATNNLMSRVGVPVALADAVGMHATGIPGWISGPIALGARLAYQSKNPLILDQLSNALVNPNVGLRLLQRAPSAFEAQQKIPIGALLESQIPRAAGGVAAYNLLTGPSGARP